MSKYIIGIFDGSLHVDTITFNAGNNRAARLKLEDFAQDSEHYDMEVKCAGGGVRFIGTYSGSWINIVKKKLE